MGSTKLQTTLTGYAAFMLAKLAERKGKTQAEIASYLIERWLDDNAKYLSDYGITPESFDLETRGGTVVQIGRSNEG